VGRRISDGPPSKGRCGAVAHSREVHRWSSAPRVCGTTISRPGFTLLEAIVALAIISMVAVSTLIAVGAQLRSTEHAQRTTEAVALAEERMTAIRLLSAGDLQALPDSIASGRFAPPLNLYTWNATTQPVYGEDGLNTITVQIDWPGGTYALASRVFHSTPIATASADQFGSPLGSGGGGGFQFQSNGSMSFGGGGQ
jgi:type II secretion system protein I